MRQPVWPPPRWRQLRARDRRGFVVVMRSVDTQERDRYWCGPAAPDSSTTWLRHTDPFTGADTVPKHMAVFNTPWDATIAWARYLSQRRRRGIPVPEFAHFQPLDQLRDWSTVAPLPSMNKQPESHAAIAAHQAVPRANTAPLRIHLLPAPTR